MDKAMQPQPRRSHLFKRWMARLALFLALVGMAVLPVGLAASVVTPVQAAGPAWYDGPIQYSTITNCVSIIQGLPYQENGIGTYVGFLADPEASLPTPNATYYIHVVIAGMGNACSGMRAYIDIGLPANTSLAIDPSHPVYCLYDNVPLAPASDCPQTLPASAYNPGMYELHSPDSAHAYTWPIPLGRFLEIQVPVRSTSILSGNSMQAKVKVLDGNDSPWLTPQQGVFVFSSEPTILYPSPSTTLIKSNTAHSEAFVYTYHLGGTGYFDLGTTTSYGMIHEQVIIDTTYAAYRVWDDWDPVLQPDTLYHWRFMFNASNGQTYYGADQTFRTLPDGTATVGSGATGSCTEAALSTALATAANKITFACGPLPTTITLTSAKTITGNTTISGGNTLTFSGNGASSHFNVQSGGHLTLNQVKLENGANSFGCGGSIHVLANGQLTINETSFKNNSGLKGGAVCIDSGASAGIHTTAFSGNHSNGGGAIHNLGTLVLDHSSFTTNSSSSHGGALQNYGTATVSDTSFNQNTAVINGGGIDTTVLLTLTGSSFSENSTGIRGGAINNYLGSMNINGTRFLANHSAGYGGALANDEGTAIIQTSEFSGNTAKSVGGGLRNNGNATVTNSTFSGNHVDSIYPSESFGGAIENSSAIAYLTLINTTLAGNSATTGGGNLYIGSLTSDHIQLKNTLITAGTPNNCDQPVFSQGYNLESANTCGLGANGDWVNTSPKIGPLQNNGGKTSTHALRTGSPAIDAGINTGCPATDQRGNTRPFDGNGDTTATCDIGAYEYSGGGQLYLPILMK